MRRLRQLLHPIKRFGSPTKGDLCGYFAADVHEFGERSQTMRIPRRAWWLGGLESGLCQRPQSRRQSSANQTCRNRISPREDELIGQAPGAWGKGTQVDPWPAPGWSAPPGCVSPQGTSGTCPRRARRKITQCKGRSRMLGFVAPEAFMIPVVVSLSGLEWPLKFLK